jgi:glutamine synthetase
MENKDSLKIANDLYVDVNIFKEEHKDRLEQLDYLPASCCESADYLNEQRSYFEKNNVFPKGYIDNVIRKLKEHNDKDLSERLYGRDDEIRKLVYDHLHCM